MKILKKRKFSVLNILSAKLLKRGLEFSLSDQFIIPVDQTNLSHQFIRPVYQNSSPDQFIGTV